MADGFRIELDAKASERLKAVAEAAGLSAQDYAQGLVEAALDDGWDESRRRAAEYDRTGEYVTVEEAFAHFDAAAGLTDPSKA